ncbi:MAG: hypothetical protein QOE92_1505, partial [Chloroflexota bacterium]|nr:hypothetical protein [Chloroflexota bacterium]
IVTRLLGACADLTVLATSREPLGVAGEVGWRVPSLGMPEGDDPAGAAGSESVRLFLERAATVAPGFATGPEDVAAAVDICRRLDGIPLAIELAAGRVGVLTPRQVADRLDDRFRLLAGQGRAAVPRHQTLRATVDWSYELLSPAERALFERLSVFVGGWDIEAAEAVCVGDPLDHDAGLEMLGQLVSKSLVVAERRGVAARFRMLETIRDYGAQRLAKGYDGVETRRRHRDWYLAMAEEAEDRLLRGRQVSWDRLEAEHDNLRAALQISLDNGEGAEAALRLGGALGEFWDLRGNLAEGRRWLEAALAHPAATSLRARAKALNALGMLISHQGDYERAHAIFEGSLALARRGGDQQVVSTSLGNLGWMLFSEGRAEEARRYLEEGLDLARELGDRWIVARAIYLLCHVEGVEDQDACVRLATESLAIARDLGERSIEGRSQYFLAVAAIWQGRYDEARRLLEESVATAIEVGDRWQAPWSLSFLGSTSILQGDYEAAREPFERSLEMARETGNQWCVARCVGGLAWVTLMVDGNPALAREQAEESLRLSRAIGTRIDTALSLSFLAEFARHSGDVEGAVALHREALADHVRLRNRWGIAGTLERLARIRTDAGDHNGAARLYGAAAEIRERSGCPVPPVARADCERGMNSTRVALGDDFEAAWAAGREAPLEQVIRDALGA